MNSLIKDTSIIFELVLISLSALAFFKAQLGFSVRLLIVFLFLSIMFVGLSLFTGRRSAETLYRELLHTYRTINASNPSDSGKGDSSS